MTGDRSTAVTGGHVEVIGDVHLPSRPRVATRPVQLAPRPPQLVGRDEVVVELRERLLASEVRPAVVAVHGLGGVGKTSLALEYAYRHQHDYELVWQLPAADPAVLSAAFARLAALMGLRELGADAADPVDQVHAALAARTEPWLLIFDNVPEAEAVRAVLPPAGPGHVLITSRSGSWPRDRGLELPVLDLESAALLMLASTGQDDTVAAAAVVAELGALPLALEQAAAYMSETGLELSEYLDLLHHQRAELLAQGQAWGYRERVATTWQFAFRRLARTSPQAIALLRLLSCYAHEAIPYHLLLSPLARWAPRELFRADVQRRRAYGRIPGPRTRVLRDVHPSVLLMMRALPRDTLRINAALSALRGHSLIGPPVDGTVTVHRLVQAVTLDQLPLRAQRRWREVAAVLVEAVLPDNPAQKARWARYARLLPHIRTVLGPTSPGMDKTAQYLGASGDYRTAKSLFQEIADALAAALGPEEVATLTARHELALWTGEAGDPAAARDQYLELLPVYERVLGPEHPHTLTTRHNLAQWTGRAGDPVAARDQYAALLPVRQWVSGPEHPDTLTTQANLAQWTGQAGDAAAARDQYAALLPVRERVQGPEHPSTLINRHELARWTGELGDALAARDQYAALLLVRERVSGPHHPDTLTVRHELARWTGELGEAAAARDQYAALVPIRERVQGPEHPDTLTARASLAQWTGKAGDAAAARDLYAALLPVRERILGPEHPDTLTIRHELARWTGELGEAAAARDQYAALVPVRERVQGAEHPDTLTARANLAYWTGMAGDAAGARDLCAALLPVRARVLGAGHPATVTTREQLAHWTAHARP
ncbi:FxSxx-COOH system tetratricopeptide repeat protein [Nonomuraea sp. NPDC003560]|uniref:FxSxx-COOH system tetratricopeptide repeat protein n=1 Tax=Nonomuraea sp. NPDC003560 TaxID=3364341 RepID=UPI0036909D03